MGVNFSELPVYIGTTKVGFASTKDGKLIVELDPEMLEQIQMLVSFGFVEGIRIGLHEQKTPGGI